MIELKSYLESFIKDISSLELAILKSDINQWMHEDVELLAYSRLEIEGDSTHFIQKHISENPDLLNELHDELFKTSLMARTIRLNMLSTALS